MFAAFNDHACASQNQGEKLVPVFFQLTRGYIFAVDGPLKTASNSRKIYI